MRGRELWIYGGGAHARKACHAARAAGWTVRGFVDDAVDAVSPIQDVPVFAPGDLPIPAAGQFVFIAIGNPAVRRRLVERVVGEGWTLATIVHPLAWVAPDAIIDAGVIVAAGAVVETRARIGRGTIVDIGVAVDHDCRVGEFCHLRPGQVLQPATVLASSPAGDTGKGRTAPGEA